MIGYNDPVDVYRIDNIVLLLTTSAKAITTSFLESCINEIRREKIAENQVVYPVKI